MIEKLLMQNNYEEIVRNLQYIIFYLETTPKKIYPVDVIILTHKTIDVLAILHGESNQNDDLENLKKDVMINYNLLIGIIGSQEILDNYLEDTSEEKYEAWLLIFLLKELHD